MRDPRQTLIILAVFLTVLTISVGFALPLVERADPRANIRTEADGLWWAIATVTSVGYGDHYPVTPAGRSIGIALIMIGLSSFFSMISIFTIVLFQQEEENHIRRLLNRIDRLEQKLERLTYEIATQKQRQKHHMEHN